jgi:Mg2+/Co2+ transporter CorB
MPPLRPFCRPDSASQNVTIASQATNSDFLEDKNMAKMLEQLTVKRSKDGFLLTIEDESGSVTKLLADEDQLVEIVDEIERAQEVEEADEADEDADEDDE